MEFRPRWTFLKTKPSLRSVAYRQMSSAKRARFTPIVWGVSLMYRLYRVGDRIEPYDSFILNCTIKLSPLYWEEDG
jgi:hypothetical protein